MENVAVKCTTCKFTLHDPKEDGSCPMCGSLLIYQFKKLKSTNFGINLIVVNVLLLPMIAGVSLAQLTFNDPPIPNELFWMGIRYMLYIFFGLTFFNYISHQHAIPKVSFWVERKEK